MQHLFSITTPLRLDRQGHQLRSAITVFLAEVDLGPSPQLTVPKTITGKLAPATCWSGDFSSATATARFKLPPVIRRKAVRYPWR